MPSNSERPVVLVTGAARRLGRALALHLGARGWDVAVHARPPLDDAHETARRLAEGGARVAVLDADLADPEACEALVPRAVAALGRLDAVVNNASVFAHDDIHTVSLAGLERHWRANTAPALFLARALHAHLQARGARGCVVNILDQKLWNPNPDHLSYTLSKAALETAGTLMAQALAPVLRVVGVAPGVTLPSGPMSEAEFALAHQMTPLGASSTAQDIAEAVAYALGARAVTGTTLLVDGGQHLQSQPRDVFYLAQSAAATLGPAAGTKDA